MPTIKVLKQVERLTDQDTINRYGHSFTEIGGKKIYTDTLVRTATGTPEQIENIKQRWAEWFPETNGFKIVEE